MTDRDAVLGAVTSLRPDVVVHAAAWTAVDACEDDADARLRRQRPGRAVGGRGRATASDAHLVHVSTDYVFDGELDRPYHEWDRTAPRSVYGESKLAGEHEALELGPAAAVVRTSWVCGAARIEHGHARAPAGRGARRAARRAGLRRRPARVPVVHGRPGAGAAAPGPRPAVRRRPRHQPGRGVVVRVRRRDRARRSATIRRSCGRSRRPSSSRRAPRRGRPTACSTTPCCGRPASRCCATSATARCASCSTSSTAATGLAVGFTRAELESFRDATVPDLVGPGLRLLFVGINPGLWTAATATHFAHPGNRFYPALRRAGVIERDIDRGAGVHRRGPPLPRRAGDRHHEPRRAGHAAGIAS